MKTIIYNKLIRDKLAENMLAKGLKPAVRTLQDDEYRQALLDKLVEEAEEARRGGIELSSEIGDLLDVIDEVINVFDLDREEIDRARNNKTEAKGGFKHRIFLESVEE